MEQVRKRLSSSPQFSSFSACSVVVASASFYDSTIVSIQVPCIVRTLQSGWWPVLCYVSTWRITLLFVNMYFKLQYKALWNQSKKISWRIWGLTSRWLIRSQSNLSAFLQLIFIPHADIYLRILQSSRCHRRCQLRQWRRRLHLASWLYSSDQWRHSICSLSSNPSQTTHLMRAHVLHKGRNGRARKDSSPPPPFCSNPFCCKVSSNVRAQFVEMMP